MGSTQLDLKLLRKGKSKSSAPAAPRGPGEEAARAQSELSDKLAWAISTACRKITRGSMPYGKNTPVRTWADQHAEQLVAYFVKRMREADEDEARFYALRGERALAPPFVPIGSLRSASSSAGRQPAPGSALAPDVRVPAAAPGSQVVDPVEHVREGR